MERKIMKLRNILLAGFASMAILCSFSASAKEHGDEEKVSLSPMDCSLLSGTPYICVRNPTHSVITGVACSGFWGTTAMSLPGGIINPGGTSIVKLAAKCEKTLVIKKEDGTTFQIEGFDVNKNTTLSIPAR